ncbi:MAG: MotA/TolQ/ExbB proton channel family protein [Desulfobacterota bacterium]|nr:MotA/TolQ/ExbB proton channel family protein [Thermodesulfobacteriota bacterium]
MIDFIVKGGLFMYPIILCSIIALAIFLERLWVLRRRTIIPTEFIRNIEDLLRKQKIAEAIFLSEQNGSSIARVFAAGLKNASRGMWLVKESIEDVGGREAIVLEKRLTTLSTIANVSTLLGLLGTISGMIKIFNVLSLAGPGNPGILAGGIAEALITTFAGLCVAIPATAGHRMIQNRAESLIFEMEEICFKIIDIMQNTSTAQS